jgi:transcription antitermination factor NusB
MGKRRTARELAVQLLYQLEVAGGDAREVKERFWDECRVDTDVELFASVLVKTYFEHEEEVDGVIASAAENWDFERIAKVDRNILRIATTELFYLDDVPPKVALNEAIEVAKKYGSTDKSYKFVNGILDRIMKYNEKA